MTAINNDTWQIIGICVGLMAGWSVIIIAVNRSMFSNWQKGFTDKISGLEKLPASILKIEKDFLELGTSLKPKIDGLSKLPEAVQNLEKDLLKLKADLPVSYVRREDYIRFDTVTNVKLDRLHDLIGQIWKEKSNAGN